MIKLAVATAGAIVLAAQLAHAAPCIITVGSTPESCKGVSKAKMMQIPETAEERTNDVLLYRSNGTRSALSVDPETDAPRLITPGSGLANACTSTLRKVPDYGNNAPRYEICLGDLESDEGLDIPAAYQRIETAVNRACRVNGAIVYPARKFCRRDTLYRAVLDAQNPELTAHYTTQTGRAVPRVEVDPAKTY